MQMIVAGLMSLTAMGASIIAEVDPVTVVVRGGIAFVSGIALAGLWSSVIYPSAPKVKAKKANDDDDEVESVDEPESNEDSKEAA